MNYLLVAGISLFLIHSFMRDYRSGAYRSLFLFYFIPQYLGISLGGKLPVLTAHRVILIILIIFWLRQRKSTDRAIPLKGYIVLIVLLNTISLFLSVYFIPGFKKYLQFVVEGFIFYCIMASMLDSSENVKRAIRTLYSAIIACAILGFIERYSGIHPLNYIPIYDSEYLMIGNEVQSTFPHRIMFGIAMALGLIWSVYYLSSEETENKIRYLLLTFLIGSCLYFSVSRGPWMAGMIGVALMLIIGHSNIRKYILLIAIFPVAIMLIRPGVFETISGLYRSTVTSDAQDDVKAVSYKYRNELWFQAYKHIRVSEKRLAFGFGLNYHTEADLFGDFITIENRRSAFSSWDNEFACFLLEGGFLGLAAYIIFYGIIIYHSVLNIFLSSNKERNLAAAVCVSLVIVVFMMTNVKMFSPQILYIFYTMVAISENRKNIYRFGMVSDTLTKEEQINQSVESASFLTVKG